MNKPGEPPLLDGVPAETRVRMVNGEFERDTETLLDILAALLAEEDEIVGSGPDPGLNCSEVKPGSTPLFQSHSTVLATACDC